jgi:PAS domain S-box-containing protein
MNRTLRILLVEDSPDDAALVLRELERAGFDPCVCRVETAPAMQAALAAQPWDVIISDHHLPEFSAPAALQLARQNGHHHPFIIVSGAIGEDLAVTVMKQGASDYLLKDRLGRLGPAVEQAINQQRLRQEKQQAEQKLRDGEKRFRAIIENSSDGMALIDVAGNILYASPSTTRILGYRLDEFVGLNLFELVPPKEIPDLSLRFVRALQRCGANISAQFRLRHRDGSWRWMEMVLTNLLGEASVHAVVANYRDITDRQEIERQAHELRLARQIQENLFPAARPQLAGFDIGGVSYAADATGGDYFDFIPMPEGSLGVVVGDVSGHGFGPALVMATTRAYLRALTATRSDVQEILLLTNKLVGADTRYDYFVTLAFARLEPQTRSFVYASAGHLPSYILDAAGRVKVQLNSTGPPLGLFPQIQLSACPAPTLAPGDLVVFLTDGIVEARAPDHTAFGAERALDIVRLYRRDSAHMIATNLYHAVRAFSQNEPQLDDISVVVIKVE